MSFNYADQFPLLSFLYGHRLLDAYVTHSSITVYIDNFADHIHESLDENGSRIHGRCKAEALDVEVLFKHE